MISDNFLFDVSSVFFLAWALTIAALCIAAFGHDLLPSRAGIKQPRSTRKGVAGNI
jgi:hypothetical protein